MGSACGRYLVGAWREWLRSVVVIVLVITALRSAVADWNDVPTGSMRPTILEGDRIVVNKLAYDLRLPYLGWRIATWDHPRRGDIVVLRSPTDGKRLVKRVVGLPQDTVAIVDGALAVNGRRAAYSPLPSGMVTRLEFGDDLPILAAEQLDDARHPIMMSGGTRYRARFFAPVTVPEGHYFVMGDNRDHSLDSRQFGAVPRAMIVGRATAVAASVDPDRSYLPRWDRFFHGLR